MLVHQRGFSLLEIMVAMVLSSVMMIAITTFFPQLMRQYLDSYRQYRLEQAMQQILFNIEKDLRRAGFMKMAKLDHPVRFTAKQGNTGGCLIILYDLNRNGKIEPLDHAHSEWFGYRLFQGAIEQHRGVADCSGNGWEKISDLNEINITEFNVEPLINTEGVNYFMVRLQGHWRNQIKLSNNMVSVINAENLP